MEMERNENVWCMPPPLQRERDVTFPDERAPRGRRRCGFGYPYPIAAISCAGRQMTNRVHFQGFALSGVSHLPLNIELERLGGAAA